MQVVCIVVDMALADNVVVVDREGHVTSDARQTAFGTFGGRGGKWAVNHGDVLANTFLGTDKKL